MGYSRPWRDYFLNQFIPEPPFPAPLQHQKGHYLRIMDRIGANLDEVFEQRGSRSAEPGLAGLCPGAEYGPAKRWTEFAPAAQQLSERHGLHWLIFGTANEKPLAAEIMKLLGGRATDLTGRTSLLELAQQLATVQALADQRYWNDAFSSIFAGADRGDFRFDRAATDGADGRRSRGDPPSRGVQSMFSPGMPSGFSMYESGDGGRSGARGRESDGG